MKAEESLPGFPPSVAFFPWTRCCRGFVCGSRGGNNYRPALGCLAAVLGCWVTLDIPLLERWGSALRSLPRAQREWIELPEFYGLLQRTISAKYLSGKLPG